MSQEIQQKLLSACQRLAEIEGANRDREREDAKRDVHWWSLRLYAPHRLVEMMQHMTGGEATLFTKKYDLSRLVEMMQRMTGGDQN
jgi:hypothetical protein